MRPLATSACGLQLPEKGRLNFGLRLQLRGSSSIALCVQQSAKASHRLIVRAVQQKTKNNRQSATSVAVAGQVLIKLSERAVISNAVSPLMNIMNLSSFVDNSLFKTILFQDHQTQVTYFHLCSQENRIAKKKCTATHNIGALPQFKVDEAIYRPCARALTKWILF